MLGLQDAGAWQSGSAHCASRMRCKLQCRCSACVSMALWLAPCSEHVSSSHLCNVSGARADYEVDFITFFTRLTGTKMGAKFDDEAYLVPIKIDVPRL